MTVIRVEYGKAVLFQLDSGEFGILDTNFLGIGDQLVDVSNRVVSLSVSRGRQDVLEPVRSGQASVTLRNRDGVLDPLNVNSPLFPGVEPARALNIYAGNPITGTWNDQVGIWENVDPILTYDVIQVFAGIVEDIELDFTSGGDATVQIGASDALSRLALAEFPPSGLTLSEQSSGARVSSIIGSNPQFWTDETVIAAGDSVVAAGTAEGNVLEELNVTALSEGGLLFVGRDGNLVFRNRLFAVTAQTLELSDDSSGPGYESLIRQSSGESLRTVATAERAGTRLERESPLGLLRFGFRALNLGRLLLRTDGEVNDRLDFELIRRSEPNPTVRQVTVSQLREPLPSMMKLELGDPVTVAFTPPSVDPVVESGLALSIRHDFTVGAGWRTTVALQAEQQEGFLILGTGRLDFDALAF